LLRFARNDGAGSIRSISQMLYIGWMPLSC
jgi:hypothetical protein